MFHTPEEIYQEAKDPEFLFFAGREDKLRFLLKNKNMTNEYLGACLSYIGSIVPFKQRREWRNDFIIYPLGTRGLIKFIQHWIKLNKGNLIWANKDFPAGFKLPYLDHGQCPREENHFRLREIRDNKGRIRCANVVEKKFKPSFVNKRIVFDDYAKLDKIEYYEVAPKPLPKDTDGKVKEESPNELAKFEEEEPTFIVTDACYAVLSDEGTSLPLEAILDRLNLLPKTKTTYCRYCTGGYDGLEQLGQDEREVYEVLGCLGHPEENTMTMHYFNGWELAWHIQKWYEQVPGGKAPIFNNEQIYNNS